MGQLSPIPRRDSTSREQCEYAEEFARAVHRMHAELRGIVRRITGSDLLLRVGLEDLLQDVQICAWRNADKFRGTDASELKRWMATIARHTVLNLRRVESAAKRTPSAPLLSYDRHPTLLSTASTSSQNPAESLIEAEERSMIRKITCEALSDEDRAIIDSLFYQGVSQTQLARRKRMHPSSLRRRLQRSLDTVRSHLRQHTETLGLE